MIPPAGLMRYIDSKLGQLIVFDIPTYKELPMHNLFDGDEQSNREAIPISVRQNSNGKNMEILHTMVIDFLKKMNSARRDLIFNLFLYYLKHSQDKTNCNKFLTKMVNFTPHQTDYWVQAVLN